MSTVSRAFAGILVVVSLCLASPRSQAALTGEVSTLLPESVDLTADGESDWAVWGIGVARRTSDLEAYSRKGDSEGAPVGLISDPVDLNDLAVGDPLYVCSTCDAFGQVGFDWTDGAPVATGSDESAALLFRRQGVGSGFSLNVPASTATQVLTLYVSTYHATAELQAALSDESGLYTDATLTHTDLTPGSFDQLGVYTLEFDSATPDTTLDVTFSMTENLGPFENLGLIAATLRSLPTDGGLLGDYNGDSVVNAADYTLWRDSEGEDPSVFAEGSRDPSLEGPIGPDDYNVWTSGFGDSTISGPAAVPEPSATVMVLAGIATVGARRRSV